MFKEREIFGRASLAFLELTTSAFGFLKNPLPTFAQDDLDLRNNILVAAPSFTENLPSVKTQNGSAFPRVGVACNVSGEGEIQLALVASEVAEGVEPNIHLNLEVKNEKGQLLGTINLEDDLDPSVPKTSEHHKGGIVLKPNESPLESYDLTLRERAQIIGTWSFIRLCNPRYIPVPEQVPEKATEVPEINSESEDSEELED